MLPTAGSEPQRAAPADLLAGLPEEILTGHVLAGLPARDVVRTSVLSSRPWRNLWESVPNLDVDLDGVRGWDSAAAFLQHCAAPVGRVRIRGVPRSHCHLADDWVRLVAGKSPPSLSLALPSPPAAALPSLFACDPNALAELKLESCGLPSPPSGFAGFRSLITLDLDNVVLYGERGWAQLEAMIAATAPTLEQLRLADIAFRGVAGDWAIQAPNLRRLVLRLCIGSSGLSRDLGSLPKLEYASVLLCDLDKDNRDCTRLLTALSSVRELELGYFDSATYQDTFGDENTPVSSIAEQMLRLLPDAGLVRNLEYFYMNRISCSPNDMNFIKHIVLYARNLKLASMDLFEFSTKTTVDAARELIGIEKGSPAAEVCFNRGDFCV
ncbi:hypothetical protein BAE44_0013276 [Dichanthelium oligosanthes]|uniref:F-box domain-containing protein n=1 Tax=Dichanthelium oligosanthes TaxID=888268 RepID=A0A1E5VKP1_9POAL|nr:hypothetical protein BAE44_0013276 [Dichanthelium oligosanthes]